MSFKKKKQLATYLHRSTRNSCNNNHSGVAYLQRLLTVPE